MIRHTKAMHLLEAGINLIYLRDLLGHVNVTTTEIYLRANMEVKKKSIGIYVYGDGEKGYTSLAGRYRPIELASGFMQLNIMERFSLENLY